MVSPVSPFIFEAAGKYQLNPRLIAAVIHQESRGKPFSVRYEHGFFIRYIKPYLTETTRGPGCGFTPDPKKATLPAYFRQPDKDFSTEIIERCMSWGLMQVMGQTAREYGFSGKFLAELLHPHEGIEWGCKILADYLAKEGFDLRKGLLRYNGGGNKAYPDEVIGHMETAHLDYLLVSELY